MKYIQWFFSWADILWICLFALGCTDCATVKSDVASLVKDIISAYDDNFTVYITPGFSQSEQANIQEGLADWQKKVPVKFVVILGNCAIGEDHICYYKVQTITVPNGDEYAGYTFPDGVIQLAAGYASQRVAGHEMGHAMGLRHDVEGTLMYPGGPVTTVQPADVRQWYHLRNRVAPNDGIVDGGVDASR